MANFFVIFNRREQTAKQAQEQVFAEGKLLPAQTTAPTSTGMLEDALVLKVEATTVAQAQRVIQSAYPGVVTGTPVVVTEAQFKES